jgi:Ferritin-like
MPDQDSFDPTTIKLFPRNLTARADHRVRGNPASSRTESGVDNCYPGLEFDARNLDKAFFPGLIFEFHGGEGVRLRTLVAGGAPAQNGLTNADIDAPLYLWAVMGRTLETQDDSDPPALFFAGLGGLDVWRRVHDLLPGRIGILIGPGSGFAGPSATPGLVNELDRLRDANQSRLFRDSSGALRFAMLIGERARYLDEGGVIDPLVFAPGELTRSLCVPWQYDFRDCGCFYWAANKPDMVSSADGSGTPLNFMRRDRDARPPPEAVLSQWQRDAELGYAELIAGAWNDLPVVIDDRETDTWQAGEVVLTEPLTRARAIEELRYLATVEHALCVEYLYAHYSLAAPMALPAGADVTLQTVFRAAEDVFTIAVDEMRHLRWVNEALALLEQPAELGRATVLGRALQQPFALQPLTPEQLTWFIQVEAPSQQVGTRLDGMYVRLLLSIEGQPELFPERERLVALIKLIIDEGGDHHRRFLAIEQRLSALAPAAYLRVMTVEPPQPTLRALQDLSDQNYALLLGSLALTFSFGDRAGGSLMEQARRAMFNLHETNHYLASQGASPRFVLPAQPAPLSEPRAARAFVDRLEGSLKGALARVTDVGGSAEKALARRQETAVDQLLARFRELVSATPG